MTTNTPGISPTAPIPDDQNSISAPTPTAPTQSPLNTTESATKPFALPAGAAQETPSQVGAVSDKPSLMDLAQAGGEGKTKISQEQVAALSSQIDQLNNRFRSIQGDLKNPQITQNFTKDHYDALYSVVNKMNPDLNTMAKNSDTAFSPPEHHPDESALSYIARWIDGSQQTLTDTADYLGSQQTLNPVDFMKVQYAVQRAVQKGELFSSIVGASVSGIKTIMSTQLG